MPLTAKPPSQLLVDLVGALGGSWQGHTAMCCCPAHADGTASLSLRQGDRDILVTCFAGCEREDVLRALRRVSTGHRFPPPPRFRPQGTANIHRIWEQGSTISGTLADRYLRERNLTPQPDDLRFHPRCPYGPAPHTVFKPALLVAVRELNALLALQRIFLDPKTADYLAKVMIGTPARAAWRGAGFGRVLAIAEGFETAAAFTILHGLPCWASLGARRLDQLIIPDAVETLIIAEDNDPEGYRAASKAVVRYERPGLTIDRAPPPRGFKDWAKVNDDRVERGGGSKG